MDLTIFQDVFALTDDMLKCEPPTPQSSVPEQPIILALEHALAVFSRARQALDTPQSRPQIPIADILRAASAPLSNSTGQVFTRQWNDPLNGRLADEQSGVPQPDESGIVPKPPMQNEPPPAPE